MDPSGMARCICTWSISRSPDLTETILCGLVSSLGRKKKRKKARLLNLAYKSYVGWGIRVMETVQQNQKARLETLSLHYPSPLKRHGMSTYIINFDIKKGKNSLKSPKVLLFAPSASLNRQSFRPYLSTHRLISIPAASSASRSPACPPPYSCGLGSSAFHCPPA